MTRNPRAGLAALALAGLGLAGCATSSPHSTGAAVTVPEAAGTSTANPGAPTVDARSTRLGRVLTTANGNVIYMLTADRPGTRSCSGACLQYWPPVTLEGTPSAGPGITAHLGYLAVSGGRQLTVNGLPAYTYSGDRSAGQTAGQGIHSFGGTWWVLSTTGAPITSAGAPTSTTSPAGGYSGY